MQLILRMFLARSLGQVKLIGAGIFRKQKKKKSVIASVLAGNEQLWEYAVKKNVQREMGLCNN